MENNNEVILEEKAEDSVIVEEQKPEEEVDLSNVELMSNGKQVEVQPEEPKGESNEQPQPEPEKADEGKEYQQTKADIEGAKTELQGKGLDTDKMEAEYLEKGELSEDSIKALKDAGYSEAIIKATLAGWQANADRYVNTVISHAGGSEVFSKMQKFIEVQGQNAITAFNTIMETGDLNTVKAYVDGIKAQMVAKYGTSNPTLMGGNAVVQQGFSSWEAVTKAMSDPRYGRNAAYTKAVEDKLAKSNF